MEEIFLRAMWAGRGGEGCAQSQWSFSGCSSRLQRGFTYSFACDFHGVRYKRSSFSHLPACEGIPVLLSYLEPWEGGSQPGSPCLPVPYGTMPCHEAPNAVLSAFFTLGEISQLGASKHHCMQAFCI